MFCDFLEWTQDLNISTLSDELFFAQLLTIMMVSVVTKTNNISFLIFVFISINLIEIRASKYVA